MYIIDCYCVKTFRIILSELTDQVVPLRIVIPVMVIPVFHPDAIEISILYPGNREIIRHFSSVNIYRKSRIKIQYSVACYEKRPFSAVNQNPLAVFLLPDRYTEFVIAAHPACCNFPAFRLVIQASVAIRPESGVQIPSVRIIYDLIIVQAVNADIHGNVGQSLVVCVECRGCDPFPGEILVFHSSDDDIAVLVLDGRADHPESPFPAVISHRVPVLQSVNLCRVLSVHRAFDQRHVKISRFRVMVDCAPVAVGHKPVTVKHRETHNIKVMFIADCGMERLILPEGTAADICHNRCEDRCLLRKHDS